MKSVEPTTTTCPESDAYRGIVDHIHSLYGQVIPDWEAHEAARNLIGFCQVLLEIKSQNS